VTDVSELLFDEGVLVHEPLIEFEDFRAVERFGGTAVLPWRHQALAANSVEIKQSDTAPSAGFSQAVVHVRKNRDAVSVNLAAAWRALKNEGRLLVCGDNGVGIASFGKRLGQELGQQSMVLANRLHGRVLAFTRDEGPGPAVAKPSDSPLFPDSLTAKLGPPPTIRIAPGVFSAGRLDAGTAMLLSCLADQPDPRRVVDLGCGAGHLALTALMLWPQASAVLADGDWRAVACARENSRALNLADRTETHWWDAREPVPASDCDLALVNPPFHVDVDRDFGPAQAMFQGLRKCLGPHGRALVVANRKLPYESELEKWGRVRTICQAEGYKILELTLRDGHV
jgi:16S rRNA (guanine1207-N2)-methyltransferase